MKISKLFHTLYAFLMFLPVMVLPLFAININQKEVEPLTAQIEETKLVDFNQLLNNNDRSGTLGSPYGQDLGTFDFDNKLLVMDFDVTQNSINVNLIPSFEVHLLDGHYYYLKQVNVNASLAVSFFFYDSNGNYSFNTGLCVGEHNVHLHAYSDSGVAVGSTHYEIYFSIFDFTQMFGSGNEPTTQQFDIWYPDNGYLYTLGKTEILHTGVVDTLNNTDVGSQFLYSLYNPLKDYFNLPNYMNLGGLYDWFLLNLFSGYNSPVYFIIFDLMIYWLAMSLLWLIFDVLMYVPSMIHKMLDKARME